MGVLLSKKQQVEKVQKCNTVISAFKEGIRDRPAPPSQAERPAGGGARGADPAPQPRKAEEEEEEGELKENGGNRKSHNAQRPSAPPKEEGKANQEAWSRLRDGRGAEPEDMDRMNQLTPPAFVRPKKDVNDDRPVEVDLGQREQLANAEACEICEVWTAEDLFPCRTCSRVFHDGCLRELGYLRTAALEDMRESAHTATGWSCYYCDNVNLLLTEEEMYTLMEAFKRSGILPESCLASEDFLHYKQQLEPDLTVRQEEEVMAQFSALDPGKRGRVEWADFLYHESLGLLRRSRAMNSLVRLLTAKERERARAVFLGLDRDRAGLVTWTAVQRAQQSWFQKPTEECQSCSVSISHVGPISESSPASGRSPERAPITSEEDDNRRVTWPEFLKESAIYILASRPNSRAVHLCPPL
ncbi:PHD finger protein 24-like [Conger conger]|uniref:PHD finger protein 24-like n=1 Tax=Conger conger TaxID=82655 RepID=UPI002A5A49F7|nr:PHD finger protein 24-like [Conger conger]